MVTQIFMGMGVGVVHVHVSVCRGVGREGGRKWRWRRRKGGMLVKDTTSILADRECSWYILLERILG